MGISLYRFTVTSETINQPKTARTNCRIPHAKTAKRFAISYRCVYVCRTAPPPFLACDDAAFLYNCFHCFQNLTFSLPKNSRIILTLCYTFISLFVFYVLAALIYYIRFLYIHLRVLRYNFKGGKRVFNS